MLRTLTYEIYNSNCKLSSLLKVELILPVLFGRKNKGRSNQLNHFRSRVIIFFKSIEAYLQLEMEIVITSTTTGRLKIMYPLFVDLKS